MVSLAVGRIDLAALDAVTFDVYGTLVGLIDPLPKLSEALASRGVVRSPAQIRAAFEAEGAYYLPRAHEGRDAASLADLNERSAAVFLASLDADLPPREFAPIYVEALEFELLQGAAAVLRALRSRGLELAVVANWNVTVHDHLAALGLAPFFSHVLTAAETGVRKPEPAIFRRALDLLGVAPERALHVGDDEVDRQGALASGMQFAPAPVERLLELLQ